MRINKYFILVSLTLICSCASIDNSSKVEKNSDNNVIQELYDSKDESNGGGEILPIGDFPPLPIPTNQYREKPLTIREKKLVEEAIQKIKEKQKSKKQKEILQDQDVKDEHKQVKDLTIDDLARIKNEIIKSISLNQKFVSVVFKDERIKAEVIFLNLEDTNSLLSRLEIEKEDIKYKSMYCMNEAFKVALLQDIPLQISFNTSKSELIFETTSIGANCKN